MLGTFDRERLKGFGLLALGCALVIVAACQAVAGVQDRNLNPILSGCALPTGSGPHVRIANLVPSTQNVDVCIRAAGGSWGEPLLLNGGTDCGSTKYFGVDAGAPVGFAYSQVSVDFAAPADSVDVEIVKAGATCGSTPLAKLSNQKLVKGDLPGTNNPIVTTLLFVGGNGVPEKLEALTESITVNASALRTRFVHAMPGVGPLDYGVGTGNALPTSLGATVVANPIAFGATAVKGEMGQESPVLDNGYVDLAAQTYLLVAAVHGAAPEKAILGWKVDQLAGATYSVYAVGVPRSTQFPQRALTCYENSKTTLTNPLLMNCSGTPLPSIAVDILNVGLYGPGSPNFVARQTYWEDPSRNPVVTEDTDLVCLAEIDYKQDITDIASAVGATDAGGNGRFPYSYWASSVTVTTPPTNPQDINGNTPPSMLSIPPCGGSAAEAQEVADVLGCFEQNCSSIPDSGTGVLSKPSACLTQNCLINPNQEPDGAAAAGLATILKDYPSCLNCVIDYVVGQQPFDTAYSQCTQNTSYPYAFNGQSATAILSRYPIIQSDVLVLPSTNYRQTVSYARVQLEDSQVDFYCGFFSSTLVADTLPYPSWSPYGNGGTPSDPSGAGAYGQEQKLQAADLITWVGKKSQGKPAIIAGDWRSGVGNGTGGTPPMGMYATPENLVPETQAVLRAANGWVPAAPPNGWTQCNFCPESENPLNTGMPQAYYVSQPFLANWGTGANAATIDESLRFTDNVIDLGNGMKGPISPYYGVQIHVQRPQ